MGSSTASAARPTRRSAGTTSSACSSRGAGSSWRWSSTCGRSCIRYCTRMTGSVADGEDVVQETLARAYYELSAAEGDAGRCGPGCSASPTTARSTTGATRPPRRASRSTPRPRSPTTAALEPDNALARAAGGAGRDLALPGARAGAARLRHPEGRARPFARGDRRRARAERAGGQGGAAPRPRRAARSSAEHRRRAAPRRRRSRRRCSATRRCSTPTTGTACARCWPTTCGSTWCRAARRPGGARSAATSPTTSASPVGAWQPAWFDGREVLAVLRRGRGARRATSSSSAGATARSSRSATSATCPTSCRKVRFNWRQRHENRTRLSAADRRSHRAAVGAPS